MDFFQELTFTAFLAIILSFFVAKLVSFSVSNPSNGDAPVSYSVTESSTVTEVGFNRGLAVKRAKGKKRVKFVDHGEIKRVDRFETGDNGSDSAVFSNGAEPVGEVVVKEEDKDGNIQNRVDQSDKDEPIMNDSEMGCSKTESFSSREGCGAEAGGGGLSEVEEKDGALEEKEKTCQTSGKKGLIAEEGDNEIVLACDETVIDQREGSGIMGSRESEGLSGENVDEDIKAIRSGVDEDDDWEGIERSELEKVFAEAVNFVECGGGKEKERNDDQLTKLDSDVKMQLYGLHKVAVEGPCHDAQPMALLVSSRAKWNAWQKLGSMSQEEAMEKYIRILSDSLPSWMQVRSAEDDTQATRMFETTADSGSLSSHVPAYTRKEVNEVND